MANLLSAKAVWMFGWKFLWYYFDRLAKISIINQKKKKKENSFSFFEKCQLKINFSFWTLTIDTIGSRIQLNPL